MFEFAQYTTFSSKSSIINFQMFNYKMSNVELGKDCVSNKKILSKKMADIWASKDQTLLEGVRLQYKCYLE